MSYSENNVYTWGNSSKGINSGVATLDLEIQATASEKVKLGIVEMPKSNPVKIKFNVRDDIFIM